jgi:hypothetical protein
MRVVVFEKHTRLEGFGGYNPGEVAGFPDHVADALIARGNARAQEESAAAVASVLETLNEAAPAAAPAKTPKKKGKQAPADPPEAAPAS